jgi:DNA-directed RNA polymerase subunit RPC12/RpoP
MKEPDNEAVAANISDVISQRGSYVCKFCDVFMLPIKNEQVEPITRCPQCGVTQNVLLDSMKHASTLMPAVTEEQITEGEIHIFEIADDESGFPPASESREEVNEILEQDKEQDEAWRRKGFKVTTI